MEIFKRTSNVAPVVVEEKVTRTAINNFESHIKQIMLSGNAMEEYQIYNYEFVTDFKGKRYRDIIKEHLKKGTKFDKTQLGKNDFWVGRTYKKSSGKTTTYVESMTVCPPFKIHPDQIEQFLKSPENTYFEDFVFFLKHDERFKDCLFLDFKVHMNEVYVPESITLEEGTEYLLPEEERWQHAYIKPHMHIAYIPTVKAVDEKTGAEYLKLSRKDLWRSDGKFTRSYSEFIDKKYEAVDMEYGLERGEVYEEMPEEEKPIHMGLEEWKKKNDQKRIDKLIQQQQKENQKNIERLNKEVELIQQQTDENNNIIETLEQDLQDSLSDMAEQWDLDYNKMDYALLRAERKMFLGLLGLIEKIIEPLAKSQKSIFDKIHAAIIGVKEKICSNDKVRNTWIQQNQGKER